MNLRTVMTIMTFIVVFTAIPFAVSAEKGNEGKGQGEETSEAHRPEKPSVVETKSSKEETASREREMDSKQSPGVDQAKNKTQETAASIEQKKPDHANQPPEHSNSERADDHGQNSKADKKIDREKKN
ncbi:hypothetical protein, partial [Halobacillus sp. BBL2006]|uniref:hypothetical protein n=1 Tax=Halobacillus sp. BBL2006 TaxID=1543706 RepID=UPI00054248B0